jgi:HCOMODA/2-hydroxy-3-carboxy-muconic semialdehyde decarboxylase
VSQAEELAAAYRILADHGVVDAYGHVSMRSEHNLNRYLIGRSLAPELMTPADIMECDLDSNPQDDREPVNERFIHGEVYKARPEITAVVHNHSLAVIPFSVSGVALRPVYHMAAFVGYGVPVFEIRDVPGKSGMLVRTPESGAALARVLGDKPAALMRGHGAVTVGENLARAVGRSVYLDQNARLQLQALALAGPDGRIVYIDEEETRSSADAQDYGRAWPLWRAKALAAIARGG